MNEIAIVMAIMGCADGGQACETVRSVEAGFESVAQCNAATPAVLQSLTDLQYPVIMARCTRAPRGALAQASPTPQS